MEFAVTDPGVVPKLASELIDRMPSVMVVPPAYVLLPNKTRVPLPAFVSAAEPDTTP